MRRRETESETGRRRYIVILTHDFFSWPYQAVLFSKPYAFSSPTRHTQSVADCGLLAQRWPWFSICQLLDFGYRCKTAYISRKHPHISFHNACTFPLNHVTAFAYLLRCVLYREIADWLLGQGSMCNSCFKYEKFIAINVFLFSDTKRERKRELKIYSCYIEMQWNSGVVDD